MGVEEGWREIKKNCDVLSQLGAFIGVLCHFIANALGSESMARLKPEARLRRSKRFHFPDPPNQSRMWDSNQRLPMQMAKTKQPDVIPTLPSLQSVKCTRKVAIYIDGTDVDCLQLLAWRPRLTKLPIRQVLCLAQSLPWLCALMPQGPRCPMLCSVESPGPERQLSAGDSGESAVLSATPTRAVQRADNLDGPDRTH